MLSTSCRSGRLAFTTLPLAFFSACADIGSEPRLPPATLTLISGGNQSVVLGSELPQPIVVRLDTAGVPAPSVELVFVIVAETSPGPNHTWFAQTDQAGIASANGTVSNTGVRGATITVRYIACVDSGFISCDKSETRATVSTSLIVTQ